MAMNALENLTLSNLKLDGNTAILGLVGDPIAQVKASLPLTQLLQQRGFNALLIPLHVSGADVPALLDILLHVKNFAGLIVTVPHKQFVASLGVEKTQAALEAEAVNVIRKIKGGWQADLLDGWGFLMGLVRNGFDVKGKSVCISGAGGAGNAIAFALAQAGAASLGIHDIDAMKRRNLVTRLRSFGYPAREWDGASPADLLVNATPLGMKAGDSLPMTLSAIRPGCTVADVIMEPKTTDLLALAQQRGARIVHGQNMMNEQLDKMVDFFGHAIHAMQGTEVTSG